MSKRTSKSSALKTLRAEYAAADAAWMACTDENAPALYAKREAIVAKIAEAGGYGRGDGVDSSVR